VPSRFTQLVLATTLLLFTMGHGDGCCSGDEDVFGDATGATCPQGSTLTYASFGQQFMASYCTRCHASTLAGEARMGAPAFHDFDAVDGIRAVADHIDETAASGPDATNEAMPPGGAKPTLAERQMLAEWIACGAP
jgi:uncharacterized membrane protein